MPDYILPVAPSGMMLEIAIYSTCGDLHYVGLNGLQVLDLQGREMTVLPDQIFAVPERCG